MSNCIQVLYPSSQKKQSYLEHSLQDLHKAGFSTEVIKPLTQHSQLDEYQTNTIHRRYLNLFTSLKNMNLTFFSARGLWSK